MLASSYQTDTLYYIVVGFCCSIDFNIEILRYEAIGETITSLQASKLYNDLTKHAIFDLLS